MILSIFSHGYFMNSWAQAQSGASAEEIQQIQIRMQERLRQMQPQPQQADIAPQNTQQNPIQANELTVGPQNSGELNNEWPGMSPGGLNSPDLPQNHSPVLTKHQLNFDELMVYFLGEEKPSSAITEN